MPVHFRCQLFGSLRAFGTWPEVHTFSIAEYLTAIHEAAVVQIGVNGTWAGQIGGGKGAAGGQRETKSGTEASAAFLGGVLCAALSESCLCSQTWTLRCPKKN